MSKMTTLKKIDIHSAALIQGYLAFFIGLIAGVVMLVVALFGSAVGGGGRSVIMGLVMAIIIPFLYGLFGYIAGAIGALLYNLAAKKSGGIKWELE